MPPWPPGLASPTTSARRAGSLTAQQRSTILSWAKAGGKASGPEQARLTAKTDVRPGERVLTLGMPAAYRPTAKNGATDDYRCFLLDPKLTEDAYATSARIVPRARSIVHHVILFRISANALSRPSARRRLVRRRLVVLRRHRRPQRERPAGQRIVDLRMGAGLGAGRFPDGTGVALAKGDLVVMQVHYNLLNGRAPDRSQAVFTLAPPSGLKSIDTVLLPAPVELACVKGEARTACNRDAAIADLGRKYGAAASFAPTALLAFCGHDA